MFSKTETRKYDEMSFMERYLLVECDVSVCINVAHPFLLWNSTYTTYDLVNSWFRC
jgi:hypothetical protein